LGGNGFGNGREHPHRNGVSGSATVARGSA
jgi:hypothetical protein